MGPTYFLQGLSQDKPSDTSTDDDNVEFILLNHFELELVVVRDV
jgi:hypothetical protein